jgi:hypothetical protein
MYAYFLCSVTPNQLHHEHGRDQSRGKWQVVNQANASGKYGHFALAKKQSPFSIAGFE